MSPAATSPALTRPEWRDVVREALERCSVPVERSQLIADTVVRALMDAGRLVTEPEVPALEVDPAPECPSCGRRFSVAARMRKFPRHKAGCDHGPTTGWCDGSGAPVEPMTDLR
jgi:hypothetical protein